MATTHRHAVRQYVRALSESEAAQNLTDRELLARFVDSRDEVAFAALVRRHGPMVRRLCTRVLHAEADGEDAFQATFLILSSKAKSLRPHTSLAGWLHRVAYRIAQKALVTAARRRSREGRVRERTVAEPAAELTLREAHEILDAELLRLPDHLREPLVLCYLEGLTRDEAAQRLGCPPGTVKSRLEQARERLQRRLIARGLTLSAALVASLFADSASASVPAPLLSAAVGLAVGRPANDFISARAAELADGALKSAALTKSKLIAVVLLIGAALAGVTQQSRPAKGQDGDPPATKADDVKPRGAVDLFGDPLPDGAVIRLGTLQRRAVGAQLAVSADGKSVISVRGGRYVTVFDAETGKLRERRTLSSTPGARYGGDGWGLSALSPDGSRLITDALADRQLLVWDTHAGTIIRKLPVRDAQTIDAVSFSPDGKSMAAFGTYGDERRLKAWNLKSGTEILSKGLGTDGWSDRLYFTPDGKHLLARLSSKEFGTCCWDFATGKEVWRNPEFRPNSVAISPAGTIYSSSPEFPSLNAMTGRPLLIPTRPPISRLRDSRVALTPDGQTLLISTERGVIVWDTASGRTLRTLAGAGEEVVAAPDSKTVYTNSGSLQRWDLATGKPLYAEDFEHGHIGEVVAVAFSANGTRLVSGSADGSVRLWDVASGKPLHVWRAHAAQRPSIGTLALAKGGVAALDISADGRWVISSGREENLKLLDVATRKIARVIDFPKRQPNEGSREILHLRLSADGKRVVAIMSVVFYSLDGRVPSVSPHVVATWDLETGKMISTRPITALGAAIAPDGERVVANGAIMQAASGTRLAALDAWPREGTDPPIAFSRDGMLIAGGAVTEKKATTAQGELTWYGPDGVRVWEATTGRTVAHLKNKRWNGQVTFHADGRFVITNDYSGVQVWDALTGNVVARRTMPEELRSSTTMGSYASFVAASPDGRRLATGHTDGTILLWDIKMPEEQTKAQPAEEAEKLWTALKEPNAGKAWRAVWRLTAAPDRALPILKRELKPAAPAPEDVTRPLLADLDAKSFDQRERAAKRLKELGDDALPALRNALSASPSTEQRRRIEDLLAAIATAPPSGDVLRDLRAIALLEHIGTPAAQDLLKSLAAGSADVQKTKAAMAAMDRIARPPSATGSPKGEPPP